MHPSERRPGHRGSPATGSWRTGHAGVDPAARDYILKTIIQDYSEDASILLSTHLIADVEQLLDDVIFLKDGQIILSSSVEEIRDTRHQSVDSYFREVFSCSQN